MLTIITDLVFPILSTFIYVVIIIYGILLAGRLVRAVEKIADKLEKVS